MAQIMNSKFRLKLKKVGKTIRPFKYDLNQIPYGYTVEVINRVKGLDMVDSEEERKNPLMKVKEESEKADFKHSKNEDHGIRSHHFMANRWGNSI